MFCCIFHVFIKIIRVFSSKTAGENVVESAAVVLSTHVFGFKTCVFINGGCDGPLGGGRGPKNLFGPGPVLQ